MTKKNTKKKRAYTHTKMSKPNTYFHAHMATIITTATTKDTATTTANAQQQW